MVDDFGSDVGDPTLHGVGVDDVDPVSADVVEDRDVVARRVQMCGEVLTGEPSPPGHRDAHGRHDVRATLPYRAASSHAVDSHVYLGHCRLPRSMSVARTASSREYPLDRVGQRGDIGGVDEQRRVPEHLGYRAGGRRDHRHARRHRVEWWVAEALVERRKHEHGAAGEEVEPRLITDVAGSDHSVPCGPAVTARSTLSVSGPGGPARTRRRSGSASATRSKNARTSRGRFFRGSICPMNST